MAGHSKWANTKHRRAAQNAIKAKKRTAVLRMVMVAVQEGGPNPDNNPRLRLALQHARSVDVPKENIKRTMDRASGQGATAYVEATYEGYAPHGVGIIIEATTDNLNRAVSAIRSLFNKHHGSLGKHGSLAHCFIRQGFFALPAQEVHDLDAFTLAMIDAGMEELETHVGHHYLTCPMNAFGALQEALEALGLTPAEAGLRYFPTTTVSLASQQATQVQRLVEGLDALDDVQEVYHNLAWEA